jgi:hypothetical protein
MRINCYTYILQYIIDFRYNLNYYLSYNSKSLIQMIAKKFLENIKSEEK